jgi:ribonuclease P protein component
VLPLTSDPLPETLGLPGKPHKLSRPEEYKAVLVAPCRLSGKNFLVRALPNSWRAARLGLIASRKAAPRAVDRNRCKRLAREAFRAARAMLPAVDIVFQQKNDLRKEGNPAIRRELDRLLHDVAVRFGGDSDDNAAGASTRRILRGNSDKENSSNEALPAAVERSKST